MKNNTSVIIPFCIYHYIDPDTQTYMGYIGNPRKTMLKDGTEIFECDPKYKIFKQWFLAGRFYAISPSFRPIPVGMRIFCAKAMQEYPYSTREITDMYDPYNIKSDCVYFTTYNQPVPNTKELYFHIIENNVFPSFNPQPPSNDQRWSQAQISPIFVMTPSTVGDDPNNIKFKCLNGKCLPWVKNIPDIYDIYPNDNLLSIDKCVLFCNELIMSKNQGRPFDLLELISAKRKPIISHFFRKLPQWVIGLSISIFVILLFIILYTLKNKNDINKNIINK